MATNSSRDHSPVSLTNYCAYLHPDSGAERIGHMNLAQGTIQPLSFASGTPLSNLYEVIAVGENGIIPLGELLERSTVKLLAPINGRDVLCVGKNYRYGTLNASEKALKSMGARDRTRQTIRDSLEHPRSSHRPC